MVSAVEKWMNYEFICIIFWCPLFLQIQKLWRRCWERRQQKNHLASSIQNTFSLFFKENELQWNTLFYFDLYQLDSDDDNSRVSRSSVPFSASSSASASFYSCHSGNDDDDVDKFDECAFFEDDDDSVVESYPPPPPQVIPLRRSTRITRKPVRFADEYEKYYIRKSRQAWIV